MPSLILAGDDSFKGVTSIFERVTFSLEKMLDRLIRNFKTSRVKRRVVDVPDFRSSFHPSIATHAPFADLFAYPFADRSLRSVQ